MNKYPQSSFIADAIYSEPIQAIYKGNPFIEALPDNQPPEEIYRDLLLKVPYSEEERKLPAYERRNNVPNLELCFQPLSNNIVLAERFLRAIKMGYVQRNPLSSEFIKQQKQLYNCVVEKDASFKSINFTNAIITGFSIIGYSGMGKTSSINRVLSCLPQIIHHSNYKGIPFNKAQIVWLKINCPHDGSVKGICQKFFETFDILTGDNTHNKYSDRSTHQMIPEMALIARRHGLGVLIIDEIQFLNAAKSGGREQTLNYIIDLMNIGVPVILVGTPPAIAVLSDNLMTARRNTGMEGAVIMDFLSRSSQDWKTLWNHVWKYQWTAVKTELSEEILNILHEKSIGDIEIAMKLYTATQIRAIQQGEQNKSEVITPELIQKVFNSQDFKMTRDKLEEMKKSKQAFESNLYQKQKKGHSDLGDPAILEHEVVYSGDENRKPRKQLKSQKEMVREQDILITDANNKAIDTVLDKVSTKDGKSIEQQLYDAHKIVTPEDEF